VVRLHALRINSSKAVKLLLRNKRGKGAWRTNTTYIHTQWLVATSCWLMDHINVIHSTNYIRSGRKWQVLFAKWNKDPVNRCTIHQPTREEAIRAWEKLYSEKCDNLYCSPTVVVRSYKMASVV
jgi:hypothetical protein